MNLKVLIFNLIGVLVSSENSAEIRCDPRGYTATEEQAQSLEELLFLLEKSEESEDLV